jgi:orotidine-5'-phosphate decarboxylase
MVRTGLIVALDVPTLDDARRLAETVRESAEMLKVGLELFIESGPRSVAMCGEIGLPVMLDLKLHDIPETVERGVARASALGARLITVHAGGGPTMLRRAVVRAEREGNRTEIAAVTVLTSFDNADLARIGVQDSVAEQVGRLAKMAWNEGVRTFVCSPHEAAMLRALLGEGVSLITPGVRAGTASGGDDQKRIMTASEAIRAGARWVVVGRPIRDADDPAAAARTIVNEITASAGGSSCERF